MRHKRHGYCTCPACLERSRKKYEDRYLRRVERTPYELGYLSVEQGLAGNPFGYGTERARQWLDGRTRALVDKFGEEEEDGVCV